MALIYHIASADDWRQARAAGEYTISSRGKTLAQEGFIHASQVHQLTDVANAHYAGATGLVLLVIDTGRVRAEVRYDQVPGSAGPFPHIYGPLNTDAVIAVRPVTPGPDGQFRFAKPSAPR